MNRAMTRHLIPLLLMLLLSFAATIRAEVGVEVGAIEVRPPLPSYLGETVREMISTELISSPGIGPCLQGPECPWRLTGSIRKENGIQLQLRVVEADEGRQAGEITIRAAGEADLPGALATLPMRLTALIKTNPEPPSAAPPPPPKEPISRLHPDRLLAEMEAKKGRKGGAEAPPLPGPQGPTQAQAPPAAPAGNDGEDDGLATPDYPVEDAREEPAAPAPRTGGGQERRQEEGRLMAMLKWPVSIFHGKKEGPEGVKKVPTAQSGSPAPPHEVPSTPPYPTPDEVFAPKAPHKVSQEDTGKRPLWSRILIWPIRLFEGGGEEGGPEGSVPQAATPPPPMPPPPPPAAPQPARPERPGAQGPLWQWY